MTELNNRQNEYLNYNEKFNKKNVDIFLEYSVHQIYRILYSKDGSDGKNLDPHLSKNKKQAVNSLINPTFELAYRNTTEYLINIKQMVL